jgi:WD40 repeat protein
VQFWNWRTVQRVKERNVAMDVAAIDFTPDGRRLVLAQEDAQYTSKILMLDAETLDPVGSPVTFNGRVGSLSASADGRTAVVLAQASDTAPGSRRFARVDLLDGRVLQETVLDVDLQRLELSPDGHDAVTIGVDGRHIGVLNTETGEWVAPPVAGRASASSASWAPDGKTFATSGSNGVILWDGQTSRPGVTLHPGRDGPLISVQFAAAKNALVMAADNGAVYQLNLKPSHWIEFACRVAGRRLTVDEWRNALGERPYRSTCPKP